MAKYRVYAKCYTFVELCEVEAKTEEEACELPEVYDVSIDEKLCWSCSKTIELHEDNVIDHYAERID